MARIYKVLSFMAALVVVLVIFVWAFLSWGAFSGPRTVLASRVLAGNFGQDVSIHGDVRIGLGLDLSVTVEGLTLTSRTMPDVTVAEVGFVSFDLPLFDLWNGKPRVRNLTSDDVRLALIVDNEGNTSWAENAENDQRKAQGPNTPVSEIIADRAVRLTSISVLYKDARNGLDLTLDFADLTLDRGNQTTAPSIVGQGGL